MYQLSLSLKLYPFFFTVLLQHFFCCTFWSKSILLNICGCSAAWRRHGAGVTISWNLLWAAHCSSMLKFKDRGLSPITGDSNGSFSLTSLVVNQAYNVMAEVSWPHCLKAMIPLQTLLKEIRVLHWLNRVCMSPCLTAALTCVQISILPDE